MDVALDGTLDLEDLYATPDDGNRYEILDGAMVMTPSPGTIHQGVVARLVVTLYTTAAESGFKVFPAPLAWRIGPGNVPEPDVIVASPDVITSRAVEGPPVLVVEVLSPTGRSRDRYEKRRIYALGMSSWYWIFDPDEPSLTVLRLADGDYEEVARVVGAEAYEAQEPFPVRVTPADLLR